jgi:hypothetical protein
MTIKSRLKTIINFLKDDRLVNYNETGTTYTLTVYPVTREELNRKKGDWAFLIIGFGFLPICGILSMTYSALTQLSYPAPKMTA